jgi:DNA adenine methylase
MSSSGILPVFKYAGGKRKLVPVLRQLMPNSYGDYYEPFVGAGALWLDLAPKRAFISDSSPELINLYKVVQWHLVELIERLRMFSILHSEEVFLKIREMDRDPAVLSSTGNVGKAARFLYLNKTCFNGLMRFNKSGQFNTPSNKKELISFDENALKTLAAYLMERSTSLTIKCCDYKESTQFLHKKDFIYVDPPYEPISETSSFTAYTEKGFSSNDQVELRDEVLSWKAKGAYVMICNSASPLIYDLYGDKESFEIHEIEADRIISADGANRVAVKELVITTYRQEV